MYKFAFIHMTMCTWVTPLVLELQVVVNHPPKVDTRNWILVLWKSSKQGLSMTKLSLHLLEFILESQIVSKSSLNRLMIDTEVIHTHSLLGINLEAGKEEEIK